MSAPVVTIVTPSYNQGAFIRATIDSVLAQDYPHVEYIVMDGGSSDATAAIASEYASRLTWISERDRGQAHAINKGFIRARGTIVAWLNSDDLLLPGAVSRAVDALAVVPQMGGVYGDGYLIDREGRRTSRFAATESFNLWKLVHVHDYILQQASFFWRGSVEQVGWLDESLQFALDWDLLIRLGKKFGLQYVPVLLGALREYPEAKSFAGGWQRVREIQQILERHTGSRRPPGYWLYGLGTLQQRWNARVAEIVPPAFRFAAPIANLPMYVPTALVIRHIVVAAQGLYPDGWASTRLHWMLPEGSGDVLLRGTLPEHPRTRGVVLSAWADGRELRKWSPPVGPFEMRFPGPSRPQPFSFEIRASRYFRRIVRGEVAPRKQSFRLESVDWARDRTG